MPSGTTERLWATWGSGSRPGDVFAVGERGTLLHYDGSAWRPQASGTQASLKGIWGSGPHDIFVVGDAGTVLHRGRSPG